MDDKQRRTRLLSKLTARQLEILRLRCDGKSHQEIAEIAVITERAVADHMVRIFDKLEISHLASGARQVALGQFCDLLDRTGDPLPPPPRPTGGWRQALRWFAIAVLLCGLLIAAAGVVLPGLLPASSAPATGQLIVYDFEHDDELADWGEHPEGGTNTGQSVRLSCGEDSAIKAQSGNCALLFAPTAVINNDAYVSFVEPSPDAPIASGVVRAYVLVPSGGETCVADGCSTVKLIAWTRDHTLHESDYVELRGGRWQPLSWDARGAGSSFREVGLHFHLKGPYRGPFYIDLVKIER